MKRYKIQFYGYVQGVGFRYRAYHAAQSLRLTGYVRNEYDGSVLCEIQGDDAVINQWLVMIQNGSFIEIDRMDKVSLAVDESESGFYVAN